MKIEHLYYLEDIAKTHSITQSAQRFFLTQQGMSCAIAKLEEEFSCTFVERSNKGAYLTKQGEKLLYEMYPLIEKYKSLKQEFIIQEEELNKLKQLQGSITIESHVRTLEPIVNEAISVFKDICPEIRYTIIEKENLEVIQDIANNTADIGIIFAPDYILSDAIFFKGTDNDISFEKIFSDVHVICAHKNHPITKRKNIKLEEITNYDLVLFDTDRRIYKDIFSSKCNQIFSKDISFHKRLLLEKKAVSPITPFEFKNTYLQHKELTTIPIVNSFQTIITIVFKKFYI